MRINLLALPVAFLAAFILVTGGLLSTSVYAATSSSAVGVQGVIPSPPPTRGATITVPNNGAVLASTPITVSGLCPGNLLVKVFSNNVFVGSTVCSNGSYSLQSALFSGRNDLVTRVFDALDQAGPDSNTVTVTYSDSKLSYGSQVVLSSAYAERGAAPGTELDWPILLSGGNGPYAVSVDWGDGSPSELLSVATIQTLDLKHTYKVSGINKIIIKASDKNGSVAFLQLVGQATGAVQTTSASNSQTVIVRQTLWWPALLMLPLIFAAFYIGRQHRSNQIRQQKLDQNNEYFDQH